MSFLKKLKKALKPGSIGKRLFGSNNPIKVVGGLLGGDRGGKGGSISDMIANLAQQVAGGARNQQVDPANPFSQMFNYTPGIGYSAGPGGNPFGDLVNQMPPGLFQNPQAQAMLTQMLGGGAAPIRYPMAPVGGGSNPFQTALTPGPAPDPSTLLGQVGGFGNGGGSMAVPGFNPNPLSPTKIMGRIYVK